MKINQYSIHYEIEIKNPYWNDEKNVVEGVAFPRLIWDEIVTPTIINGFGAFSAMMNFDNRKKDIISNTEKKSMKNFFWLEKMPKIYDIRILEIKTI